jgi:acyl-CoA synthetase (AMP-forming)/AMP-acid ligase II
LQSKEREEENLGIYDELLIRCFERACEKYPDRAAIIYIGEKFSYRRLKELIDRFATALYDLGVRKNDKVMLYIPNCPQFKAMVVLKHDARGVGATELLKWCRDRLAPYKVPGYIEFRDMLPKSKVGKLLRREIREEERRRIEKGERTIQV